MRLKPGWYVLLLTALYALVVTLAWQQDRRALHALRGEVAALEASLARGPAGYTLPLPGACLPKNPDHLPGAPRPYRNGVSYGFIFTEGDACVPVPYGTGVVAAAGGTVVKAEQAYTELSPEAFAELLQAVAEGASPEQMDALRGREVWIRHPDGRITVYGHLAGLAPNLREGTVVHKGQWIGYVGNSGTSLAVEGRTRGARLLFEVWTGGVDTGSYLGEGLEPEAVLDEATRLFAVP